MATENTKAIRIARALIAKADSTEFEAEREALIAKATQIIAAHALTDADLSPEQRASGIVYRTYSFSNGQPGRATMWDHIMQAVGCATGYKREKGKGTTLWVFGAPTVLDATETLCERLWVIAGHEFALLLPRLQAERSALIDDAIRKVWQSQAGLPLNNDLIRRHVRQIEENNPRWSAAMTARARRSFQTGFAWQVYNRLKTTIDDAAGVSYLPARVNENEAARTVMFAHAKKTTSTAKLDSDALEGGRSAGARADLGQPKLVAQNALGR
jgi:Protein of unknown function (DUF2786)